jgi:two-component system sensor histidine kinase RegB
MWMAVVSSIAFTAIYAWRIANEARQLANALAATELVLQREQHLSALDGLAAAAAHELGTPLATIALVAKEMQRALGAYTLAELSSITSGDRAWPATD